MLRVILFFLFYSLAGGCEQSTTNPTGIKNGEFMKTNQYVEPLGDEPWTIVYALATLWGSINISYGFEDYKLFKKLEAKKNAGDPNATYANALYYLDYGFGTPDEQNEALENMITLTKQGHPFAAGYFARKDNEDLMKITRRFGITTKEELIEAKIKWFETAIKGGDRLYDEYAYFLLWHDKRPEDLILKDWALYNDNPKVAKIVFDNFYAHASKSRSPFSAAYVAEAYYLGVGVEKDLTRAYAWAKLVASKIKIVEASDVQEILNIYNKMLPDLQRTLTEEQLKQGEVYFRQLKQEIPGDSFMDFIEFHMQWQQGYDEPQ